MTVSQRVVYRLVTTVYSVKLTDTVAQEPSIIILFLRYVLGRRAVALAAVQYVILVISDNAQ